MAYMWLRAVAFSGGFGCAVAAAYQFIMRPLEDRHAQHLALIDSAEAHLVSRASSLEHRVAAIEQRYTES
jgi:hypothetical protein